MDCTHDVYIKGLCGNCGIKLDQPHSSSISMVHSIPELKVSEGYARKIGKAEQNRLIDHKKLVLLVDLDQTLLHTTHEEIKIESPDIHSFCLWPGHPTYHTKLRQDLETFLDSMSKIYEMHIFTFACKRYAYKISSIIDPDQRYFGNRILSRDESKDQFCKQGNLNNIFPCGDAMVVIIDDRADVWANAPNLVKVRPYVYFNSSISDGAPESPSQCNLTPEVDDDYLLNLAVFLDRVHEEWFKELEETRMFLSHGENYKLPETKSIIKRLQSDPLLSSCIKSQR